MVCSLEVVVFILEVLFVVVCILEVDCGGGREGNVCESSTGSTQEE